MLQHQWNNQNQADLLRLVKSEQVCKTATQDLVIRCYKNLICVNDCEVVVISLMKQSELKGHLVIKLVWT